MVVDHPIINSNNKITIVGSQPIITSQWLIGRHGYVFDYLYCYYFIPLYYVIYALLLYYLYYLWRPVDGLAGL